jgi:tetratricopeptide (TPR) repeat protein
MSIMHNTLSSNLVTLLALIMLGTLAPDESLAEETKETLTDEEAQFIFELAMKERDSGKVFSAIEKFEYILDRRPSLNRARLELAVSYHRAKEYDEALEEFQSVLDNPDTPEKVRLAILAYLGQLTSDELKPSYENDFSSYIKAGALYNTNINFAPLRGDLNYDIPDGSDRSSPGLDTFFSVSHRYKDHDPIDIAGAATLFEWQSQLSWTGNNYTRQKDYNVNIFSVSTGPALISTGRWRGSIDVQLDHIYFGESVLGNFISVNPLLTFDLGDFRSISVEASYMDNEFTRLADKGRNGDSMMLGAAYTMLFAEYNTGFEVGGNFTDLSAEEDQYAYSSTRLYIGGFTNVASKHTIFYKLNYEQFDYDGPDQYLLSLTPPIEVVRDDRETQVELGYNYDFAEGFMEHWTFATSFAYTRNDSNIDAYGYDRYLLSINLNRYFL